MVNVIINGAEVKGNIGNSAGGGVSVEIASESDSSNNCSYKCPSGNIINITNSRFISNVAYIGGASGAIVEANCGDSIKLSIENCVFNNNYATRRSIISEQCNHDNTEQHHTTMA